MLKINTKRGETEFQAVGNCEELAADCAVILRSVYDALFLKANKMAADMFAGVMRDFVANDETLFTPWGDSNESE